MKRKIITIDEDLCTGCGSCIPGCPEGALQVIEGKARLVSDLFCDGLGACIGHCPTGAMKVEVREAEKYDERKVMENIIAAGPATIKAHLRHLMDHGEVQLFREAVKILEERKIRIPPLESVDLSGIQEKQGINWPVQLKLINPDAACFDDADVVIAADCAPVAYPDFQKRFVEGKVLVILCPKLDAAYDSYVEKLSRIMEKARSVTIVRMEVPCCGIDRLIADASAGKDIKTYVVTIRGGIDVLQPM